MLIDNEQLFANACHDETVVELTMNMHRIEISLVKLPFKLSSSNVFHLIIDICCQGLDIVNSGGSSLKNDTSPDYDAHEQPALSKYQGTALRSYL